MSLIPNDLRYTKEHEWVKKVEDNIVLIGITDFAQSELGEIVYVEVDTIDEELDRDEVFGTVEAVKTTSDLFMPVSGKVLAFNPELDENEEDNPAIINEDPYGKAWIIKVELSNADDWEELLTDKQYEELIA